MPKKGINGEAMLHDGSMVINEGKIESSSGPLLGQDHLAQIFQRLLQSGCGEEVLTTGERFKTVTIAFPQHYYTISRRGPKIFVARLAHNSASAEVFVNSSSNTAATNAQVAEAQAQDALASEPSLDKPVTSAVDSEDKELDNKSTTTSSSIATVKSDHQESDTDEVDDEQLDEKETKVGQLYRFQPDSPETQPSSIEASIQQQCSTSEEQH